ncbi:hypothetical protein ASG25_06560 [Rhizobium sp. Leaf384]|uniref:hypothetical protein n=1 Tax=unclassified Rhizobium TaxID=2613769 RepID=UPI0007153775|nr:MULTISPECIES: hypothetical protein [unclassified Rhizobium]KQR77942.1 hypothetical protein ASG03_16445 [Rhizobium sp. Leaf341]KQS81153.1 hypothetical protein ASG25_06560 [Rhizobium sp. Leaf384]KQS87061.1 hypothetical protein ASG58_02125 [Rhizobium sp. Leaf383]
MLRKILNIVVLVPLGIVLVVLCVANRQQVTLGFNPFDPADTVLAISGPFFVFLFLAVILGLVIGACAVWFSQGKYRKRSRVEAKEALKWHTEAEKRRLQQEAIVSAQASSPAADRPAFPGSSQTMLAAQQK